ncbi:Protein HOL1 [Cyphellophora attinorum]|uniref:Protein HOL1 n=1 Tax=Cyphellophora attinorum TaxID=1664694 RepID=A0A0N1H9I1_9EURO|nr:Protein HOL1 [Phialophora attinorum]KPI44170.1 Protein HOL1 [Phialophora attinorum]
MPGDPSAPRRSTSASPSNIPKWSFGVLNDTKTDKVPGTVVLLAKTNEPLGVRRQSGDQRPSTMPSQGFEPMPIEEADVPEKKRTPSGKVILEPQPHDSPNDPLNWSSWRRDAALLSLGFYCAVAGGITPILAAGFKKVAETYHVTFEQVALTTGLYMMGLGVGGLFMSPTAILYGKRPVYLISSVACIGTSIWCAFSPSYGSLVAARVFQGISVSPVECLPSATIAEIFFLHERAYRIGIYGLLLLGGKNIMPLISAVIIQASNWRWVFKTIAIVVAFCSVMLFFFVPETFWDRTPRPASHTQTSLLQRWTSFASTGSWGNRDHGRGRQSMAAVVESDEKDPEAGHAASDEDQVLRDRSQSPHLHVKPSGIKLNPDEAKPGAPEDQHSPLPHLHNLNSPYYSNLESNDSYFPPGHKSESSQPSQDTVIPHHDGSHSPDLTEKRAQLANIDTEFPRPQRYTTQLINAPAKSYKKTLKPFTGRLAADSWLRVAIRPLILFAYPSVLWSTVVYSISVGWLIVLSESVAHVYANKETYGFTPLQCGLVYLSPFIGGVLGTAIAGKGSDFIVRAMARRNDGIYEPEFRLVMALPIGLATCIGLMGFGWSAQVGDPWIVPTIFFGIISFGCSLGATTAITFCVDSYRQYAGEALVTLNFSKNIFHGLAFSLFFPAWLEARGTREVFVILGIIELLCVSTAIPMYIYGKRARMWTVRKNLMAKW